MDHFSFMYFNWLDVVICGLLFFTAVRGMWTGLSRSAASLLGVVLGFWIAVRHYMVLSKSLSSWTGEELWSSLFAFLILFVVVYLLFVVAGVAFQKIFKALKLIWIDRVLGGIVGLAKGLLLAGVIIFILTVLLPSNSMLIRNSYFYPRLSMAARMLSTLAEEDVRSHFKWKWRRFTHAPPLDQGREL